MIPTLFGNNAANWLSPARRSSMPGFRRKLGVWILALLVAAPSLLAFQAPAASTANPPPPAPQEETPPPGDWAPQLLDAILRSPNPEAAEALLHASFAAGPDIVPFLEASLKDDRTAEFAAQSLAFIGGEKALQILWNLVSDPRDLNLCRFYYGALAEFNVQQAVETLLDVIKRSDQEEDRTVTEAAILALTVHSDPSLAAKLREMQSQVHDVVIHDDLENAIDVIELRAKFMATPEGKKVGSSIQSAVRSYFMPALQTEPAPPPPVAPTRRTAAKTTPPPPPRVKVDIQKLTLSPDKRRALARVVFEDPTAQASYDIVLQKQYGEWTVASVWLGEEVEKPELPAPPVSKRPK
jgi:hypothetical protein